MHNKFTPHTYLNQELFILLVSNGLVSKGFFQFIDLENEDIKKYLEILKNNECNLLKKHYVLHYLLETIDQDHPDFVEILKEYTETFNGWDVKDRGMPLIQYLNHPGFDKTNKFALEIINGRNDDLYQFMQKEIPDKIKKRNLLDDNFVLDSLELYPSLFTILPKEQRSNDIIIRKAIELNGYNRFFINQYTTYLTRENLIKNDSKIKSKKQNFMS